jgi:predicted Zn-dependent protease
MKKIKIQQKIQLHRDAELLTVLYRAYNNNEMEQVLCICDKILFGEKEEITRSNRDFWFYKAIALDTNRQSVEALTIFRRLIAKYPSNPKYLNSFKVSCRRVLQIAASEFEKDPDNPVLLKYYDLFHEMWHTPYYLCVAWSRHQIKMGQAEKAKEKMTHLLTLSPGETSYLKHSLELAILSGDETWRWDIERRVHQLIKKYPFRLDLYHLLPND